MLEYISILFYILNDVDCFSPTCFGRNYSDHLQGVSLLNTVLGFDWSYIVCVCWLADMCCVRCTHAYNVAPINAKNSI
jgi:hypothetical protein